MKKGKYCAHLVIKVKAISWRTWGSRRSSHTIPLVSFVTLFAFYTAGYKWTFIFNQFCLIAVRFTQFNLPSTFGGGGVIRGGGLNSSLGSSSSSDPIWKKENLKNSHSSSYLSLFLCVSLFVEGRKSYLKD